MLLFAVSFSFVLLLFLLRLLLLLLLLRLLLLLPHSLTPPQIAVSRALGDKHMKPYVSHDPDVFSHEISDNDYFVVMACDGVWDEITDKEAVNMVFEAHDPLTAAEV